MILMDYHAIGDAGGIAKPVKQAIHRLITTTSDQLIAIASRLKFEKDLFMNSGNGQGGGNRLESMPFYNHEGTFVISSFLNN